MDIPKDSILVASDGQCAFIRVIGRGSFKGSPALKKFGVAEIEKGCRRFMLDMRECLGMDSTFMGVLAGLALMLKRRANGALHVVNLSGKNLALFQTLGLTHLLQIDAAANGGAQVCEPAAAPIALQTGGSDKRTTTETMLQAHETLVAVAAENLPKFKDVLAYLRDDLKQAGGEEESAP